MNPRRSTLSWGAKDGHAQNQADQINLVGATHKRPSGQTWLHRWRTLPLWLLLPVAIAFTMQACGYMSVLGAASTIVEDTRAKIQADYSPWPLLSFLPVDPSILEQIAADTGRSIAIQDSSSQAFWWTPSPEEVEINTEEPTSVLTPGGTPTAGDGSPTATPEGSASATATLTPATTATATPATTATATPATTATATPASTATATPASTATTLPPPTATPTTKGNQYFLYTSTPQPPTATTGSDQGTGVDEQGASNQN